jgi:hypothetical protein
MDSSETFPGLLGSVPACWELLRDLFSNKYAWSGREKAIDNLLHLALPVPVSCLSAAPQHLSLLSKYAGWKQEKGTDISANSGHLPRHLEHHIFSVPPLAEINGAVAREALVVAACVALSR